MLSNIWNKIKAWFNYSWSILLARTEMLVGFMLTAIPLLDFPTLVNAIQAGVSKTQALTIGTIVLVKGLVSELGRRAGTVTLSDGQLIPAQISEKVEAVKIISAEKTP